MNMKFVEVVRQAKIVLEGDTTVKEYEFRIAFPTSDGAETIQVKFGEENPPATVRIQQPDPADTFIKAFAVEIARSGKAPTVVASPEETNALLVEALRTRDPEAAGRNLNPESLIVRGKIQSGLGRYIPKDETGRRNRNSRILTVLADLAGGL